MRRVGLLLVPAVIGVAVASGCGGESAVDPKTETTPAATSSLADATTATAVSTEVEGPAPPTPTPPVASDPKGDVGTPGQDITKFEAESVGSNIRLTWTLAGPPSGTLVSARTPGYTIAAVKVYADGTRPDAYVFSDSNTPLSTYSVAGNTVTLTVPADLMGYPTELTASTEVVGGDAADEGPTVTLS